MIDKKILILIGSLVIIGMTSYWGYNTYAAPKEEVIETKTTKANKSNVTIGFDIDGRTVISQRELSFPIGGKIIGINVKEGDAVQKWQTLAYLDTRSAQLEIEKNLRDYSKERNDFEQDQQITYKNQTLDDTIKRVLEKNQWDLEKSVMDVELKTFAKESSYLISPIDGVVAAVHLQTGQVASSNSNTPVITVINPDSLWFESYVEDIEALKINTGMPVRIKLDAMSDQPLMGTVSYISTLATIDENDLATYKVITTLNNPPAKLLDGMIGEAEIIVKEVADVITVSNTAVKRINGRSVVYVMNENDQFNEQVVELGFTNGRIVEVKSGLTSGQTVQDFK